MTDYTAYFDASGSPDEGTFLVVAGYISNVDDWLKFDVAWKKVLGWAKVKHFHMKDFVSCQREFNNKKWKREEYRAEFVKKLVAATTPHVDESISIIVPLDAWNVVNEEYRLAESECTSRGYFCEVHLFVVRSERS